MIENQREMQIGIKKGITFADSWFFGFKTVLRESKSGKYSNCIFRNII